MQTPAIVRVFNIIEYLIEKNKAVGLKEIAEDLNIPRASAFRIMQTLIELGYVHNPSKRGGFIVGGKLLSLSKSILEKSDLSQIANPFMFELAETTNQTVQLGILFQYMVMYIDQVRTTKPISIIVPTGKPFHVNLSASGKVLVAYLPDDRQEEFLQYAELKANTKKSITDKRKFLKEVQKIKRNGYSFDDEEFARGIRCIAAPIFNSRGENIAAIGITGQSSEITYGNMNRLSKRVMEIANKISRALGYSSNEKTRKF